ncbi:hypothetical protein NTGM5_290003 [Candidatus Nitrotoga sp. M5]|nr:hypothetical protein NTGM5_290003 [Candidatus Nitrotoga sp. M5]
MNPPFYLDRDGCDAIDQLRRLLADVSIGRVGL